MKSRLVLALGILCLALTACQEEPYLSVSPESISFTQDGGAQTIHVSANYAWTASASGTGFSISPSSGEGDATVTVTANPASSTDETKGSVSFKSGGLSAQVAITQGAKSILSVGQGITIPAKGGSYTVDVQYNVDLKVTVDPSASGWIKFVQTKAVTSGKLEFEIAANETYDDRSGKVTVSDASGKTSPVEFVIKQESKKAIIVGETNVIPAEGGSYEVDVQYNVDYIVTVESSAKGWIKYIQTKALTSGKLEFEIAANDTYDERSGKVTLTDASGKTSPVEFVIKQESKKAIIVGETNVIPAKGGSYEVDVQYNVDYIVTVESSAKGWIKYIQTKALTSGKLEFEIAANDTYDERSGKVTLTDASGKTSPVEFVITQEPKPVLEVGTAGTMPGEEGEFEVDVIHNYDIKVTPSEAWVRYVGEENGKLKFTVDYNYCPERKATVTVSDSNGTVNPVTFDVTQTESRFRQGLMEIYNKMGKGEDWVDVGKGDIKAWGTDAPFNTWVGTIDHHGLIFADYQGVFLKGDFPDCFEYFADDLTYFGLSGQLNLEGTLPPSFASLTNLQTLVINNTSMTSLPDYFSDMDNLSFVNIWNNPFMTGKLPVHIGDKDNMTELTVTSTWLSGEIPESWFKNLDVMHISDNMFTYNSYPELGAEGNYKKIWSLFQKEGYGFNVTGRDFKAAEVKTPLKDVVTGKPIDMLSIIDENRYTLLIHWTTWCPFSKELMPQIVKFYDKYHKANFDVVAYSSTMGYDDAPDRLETIKEKGYDRWHNFLVEEDSVFDREDGIGFPAFETPLAQVFDQNRNLVYSDLYGVKDPVQHRFAHTASSELIPFLETLFGPMDDDNEYKSTDYSHDGEVTTIQTHTVGKGIDIVFLGDGYTDKTIADGTYDRVMRESAEAFFSIEPYKSFRNRFNVYYVNAVSENGKCGPGFNTVFSCSFGNRTYVDGDLDKCYEYAMKVPGITSRENLLIPVIVNMNRSGGTAHLGESTQSAVAFYANCLNDVEVYGSTLRHEAGGHGFGFLGDEYAVIADNVPQSRIDEYTSQWTKYGWWANVDFTNNPAKIKWAKYLNDDRYKDEVGIYQGGAEYAYGVWKPTANSMMNENMEWFNAPSREAIYKRIMTLSGEGYTWEKFLEYDAINRGSGSAAKSAARTPLKAAANKKWEPSAPPVVHP